MCALPIMCTVFICLARRPGVDQLHDEVHEQHVQLLHRAVESDGTSERDVRVLGGRPAVAAAEKDGRRRPAARAAASPRTMFGERPLVENATVTSPVRDKARNWRAKRSSKEQSLAMQVSAAASTRATVPRAAAVPPEAADQLPREVLRVGGAAAVPEGVQAPASLDVSITRRATSSACGRRSRPAPARAR